MSCTPLPKAAKPVWAQHVTRLPCLVVYGKFQFVYTTVWCTFYLGFRRIALVFICGAECTECGTSPFLYDGMKIFVINPFKFISIRLRTQFSCLCSMYNGNFFVFGHLVDEVVHIISSFKPIISQKKHYF